MVVSHLRPFPTANDRPRCVSFSAFMKFILSDSKVKQFHSEGSRSCMFSWQPIVCDVHNCCWTPVPMVSTSIAHDVSFQVLECFGDRAACSQHAFGTFGTSLFFWNTCVLASVNVRHYSEDVLLCCSVLWHVRDEGLVTCCRSQDDKDATPAKIDETAEHNAIS